MGRCGDSWGPLSGPLRHRVRGEDRHAKAQVILGPVHSTRGCVPVTGYLSLTWPVLHQSAAMNQSQEDDYQFKKVRT